jgi:metal-responsive CopG/Arc/MetJ family transcriptional regulator
MNRYKANLHVKMTRQMYEKVGQLAEARDINRSELVRRLLEELIAEYKKSENL